MKRIVKIAKGIAEADRIESDYEALGWEVLSKVYTPNDGPYRYEIKVTLVKHDDGEKRVGNVALN